MRDTNGMVSTVNGDQREERIKTFFRRKKKKKKKTRHGFIEYGDRFTTRDTFFHFGVHPAGVQVQAEDESFVVKKRKRQAREIEKYSPILSEDEVAKRAFSVNLPVAALLANGYKDIKSPNDTMFAPYEPDRVFFYMWNNARIQTKII